MGEEALRCAVRAERGAQRASEARSEACSGSRSVARSEARSGAERAARACQYSCAVRAFSLGRASSAHLRFRCSIAALRRCRLQPLARSFTFLGEDVVSFLFVTLCGSIGRSRI